MKHFFTFNSFRYGYLSICKLIFENIEDNNPANNNGNTPLHYAAIYGQLEICKYLFPKIEDKHPLNRNGSTPKDLAKENNHLKIWQYFHQASVNKKCKKFKCPSCDAPPFSSQQYLLNHTRKFHEENEESFAKRKNETEISKLIQGISMVPYVKKLKMDEINIVYID